MSMMGVGLDLMGALLTFAIMVGVLLGKRNSMNDYLLIMLLINALTLLSDIGTLAFSEDAKFIVVLRVCWILQFTFLFAGIGCFNLYLDKVIGKRGQSVVIFQVIPFVIAAIMIIAWITSLKHGMLFTINNQGVMTRGQYFWITEAVGCLIIVFDLARCLTNQLSGKLTMTTASGIYIFIALPLIALPLMEFVESPAILFSAITMSFFTMYISIHVRQEQEQLEKEVDKEKMQTELILSQIQPHFIYNSLTTIKYLCVKNPYLADEAITKFTKYLRQNLDTVSSENLVSFKEEIEHTKTYLWLEQLRFGNKLNIVYSIDCDSFMIPPLSIQPIVENAVKHGVTKKMGGGTVNISVREYNTYYRIIIKDDGVGFDLEKAGEEKKTHIGINDVRKRIYDMNESTLNVKSEVGLGTTVTYEIKKI